MTIKMQASNQTPRSFSDSEREIFNVVWFLVESKLRSSKLQSSLLLINAYILRISSYSKGLHDIIPEMPLM